MTFKNKLISSVALLGMALSSSIASADDYDGLYAGLTAGMGILKTDGTLLTGPVDTVNNSGLVSALMGYRSSFGEDSPFVMGLEGSIGYYTKGSDWNYDISGIAGYKVGEKGLLYGRVGWGKLKTDLRSYDGLILGGGYEFQVNEQMNFRLDYKNISYGGDNFADQVLDFDGHQITAGVVIKF